MTGEELYRMRKDLGDAIGRDISFSDMAKLCGLAPANGADTIRKWEAGEGPSGPVAALLSVIAEGLHAGGRIEAFMRVLINRRLS